jgi:hypothetical protein
MNQTKYSPETIAPFAKRDLVTVTYDNIGAPFAGAQARVRSVVWKPYPSCKKTPEWWASVALEPLPKGLRRAEATLHTNGLIPALTTSR